MRQLVCRKGQAGDVGADALGNPGRQGTPTDTDLQDTVPGLGIHQIHHPVEFGRLGLLQRRLGPFEDRRRVDHRLVKPLGIELVPQIVVCRDVASAPGLGVCPQAMRHPVEGASRAEPIDRLVEGFPVPCHHLDHRSKVGCGPVAAHVRLGEGHVAREQQLPEASQTVDVDHAGRTRNRATPFDPSPIRQDKGETANVHARQRSTQCLRQEPGHDPHRHRTGRNRGRRHPTPVSRFVLGCAWGLSEVRHVVSSLVWCARSIVRSGGTGCAISGGVLGEAYKSGGVVGWGGKGHDRDRH